jgi:hypothetical protein
MVSSPRIHIRLFHAPPIAAQGRIASTGSSGVAFALMCND